MEGVYRFARAGNKLVNAAAMIVLAILMLYGSYSLWDSYLLEFSGMSGDLMKYKPDGPDMYSFSELKRLNPDVIGWITIDDTHVDQPVVQSQKDDMEYVNKNALGDFSLSGSVFLSVMNEADFSDPFNLTYGHHMENGGMYGDLPEFQDEKFFNSHKTGTLYSMDKVFDLEIFACLHTDAYDSNVFNPTRYQSGNIEGLLSYLKDQSVQFRDLEFSPDDQIVALSTCYDATSNGRIIVFGRMIETEKEEVGSKTWEN